MKPNFFKGKEKLTFHPVLYPDMVEFLRLGVGTGWHASEIDLNQDKAGFDKLSDDEKNFLLNTLAFFASSDGVVNKNLCDNVLPHIKAAEAAAYYNFQKHIEDVHNETYSLLIETLAPTSDMKDILLRADEEMPAVKLKIDWAKRWIDEGTLTESIVAFALVEGIFFSASFCSIYWMDYRQKGMPGLIQANKFISRDEGLHAKVACHVYNNYCDKLPDETVIKIIKDACEIEKEFARSGLPVSLIGMNSFDMEKYIEFIADGIAIKLGVGILYGSKNPFDFLVKLGMNTMTNFFESTNSEYNKAGSGVTNSIKITEDF